MTNVLRRLILLATILATVATLSSTYARPVSGARPDFSISPQQSSVTVEQTYSQLQTWVLFNVAIQSLNDFKKTVVLTSSAPTGFSISFSPASVTLNPNGAAQSTIAISSTVIGTYNVTVIGTSHNLVSITTIVVAVVPAPPDISISASPGSLVLHAGSSANSTLQRSSLNGFSRQVTILACVNIPAPPCPPTSLTAAPTPGNVTLTSGGTATKTILISSSTNTPTGGYNVWINAMAQGVVRIHQTIISVQVNPP